MKRRNLIAASAGLGILTLVLMTLQVGVDVDGLSANCGSPFDSVTGRTGWADWWARDLAEPGSTLPRSVACPDAVNRRIVAAGIALAAAAVTGLLARRERIAPAADSSKPSSDLARLATAVIAGGGVLTFGGLVAIILLVADPDSTLFNYVGRGVVALIGLIALVPAVGLLAAGLALRLIAERLDR